MDFLKTLLNLLDTSMETPTPYGWFHLLWLALSILFGILLCALHRKGDDRRVRRTVLAVAILVTVLEIYKQINYTFTVEGDTIRTYYQWYSFPFQFCSMPMYVGLLTAFFRRGRVHRALMAFLATYALFAGICVMVYPNTVFISTIGINIQTMICHGSMISVGMYLWYSGYVKPHHKTILGAMAVFAVAILCAVTLNELAAVTGILEEHTFNMFFVSPYCEPSLPVYSLVQAAVPYPFCLVIYFLGFSAAAYLILLAVLGISRLVTRCKAKTRAADGQAK